MRGSASLQASASAFSTSFIASSVVIGRELIQARPIDLQGHCRSPWWAHHRQKPGARERRDLHGVDRNTFRRHHHGDLIMRNSQCQLPLRIQASILRRCPAGCALLPGSRPPSPRYRACLTRPRNDPVTINSFGDYERIFGGLAADSPVSYAVRDFYLNGGSQAVIVRLFRPTEADRRGGRDRGDHAGAMQRPRPPNHRIQPAPLAQ